MKRTPPPSGARMPAIPPPGTPGGDQSVKPKYRERLREDFGRAIDEASGKVDHSLRFALFRPLESGKKRSEYEYSRLVNLNRVWPQSARSS
jgi:hypothetical protein